MKYIRKFNSLSEYNQAKASGNFYRPCISMIDGEDIVYDEKEVPPPPELTMVDLGLPSGTLWSKYPIGVDTNHLETASDYIGTKYAWGEITTKEYFNWGNYELGDKIFDLDNDPSYKFKKYNSSGYVADGYEVDNKKILEAADDVATVLYGNEYHIPSYSQIEELLNNTYLVATRNYNGVTNLSGVIASSKTDSTKSIFIPSFNTWYDIRIFSRDIVTSNAGKVAGPLTANCRTMYSDIDDYPDLAHFSDTGYLRHNFQYYFATIGTPPPEHVFGYRRISSLSELNSGDKVVITAIDASVSSTYEVAIIVRGNESEYVYSRQTVSKKSTNEINWSSQLNKLGIELTYVNGPDGIYFRNDNYDGAILRYGSSYYYPDDVTRGDWDGELGANQFRLRRADNVYKINYNYSSPEGEKSLDGGTFEDTNSQYKTLYTTSKLYIYKKYEEIVS